MAKIIEMDPDARSWLRNGGKLVAGEGDDFWPEVSTRYSRENPTPENPENAQGRVLLEVAVILAIVGVLAAAAAFFAPALS